jgi:hypothetical protein
MIFLQIDGITDSCMLIGSPTIKESLLDEDTIIK